MLQCYNQGTEVNNTVGTVEKEISHTCKGSDKGGSADLPSPKIQLGTNGIMYQPPHTFSRTMTMHLILSYQLSKSVIY